MPCVRFSTRKILEYIQPATKPTKTATSATSSRMKSCHHAHESSQPDGDALGRGQYSKSCRNVPASCSSVPKVPPPPPPRAAPASTAEPDLKPVAQGHDEDRLDQDVCRLLHPVIAAEALPQPPP